MNQKLSLIISKIQLLANILNRYHITLFIVFFLGTYSFLVIQIGSLVNSNPEQSAIDEKLTSVKRINIDQNSIDRILLLDEQNIEVHSLFLRARKNPFTE